MSAKDNRNNPQVDPEEKIENAIGRTESFIVQNGKMLLIILGVVLLALGGYMWYRYVHIPNQSEKAGAMMFVAEQNFATDDFQMALNGDGTNAGFLEVADRYGRTPQGNIANHYAGICYLKLGDQDAAMRYLEKYDRTKGAPNQIVNAQNLGLQGDILAQRKDFQGAADRYAKAVSEGDNSLTSPYYMKKLGLAYMELGRFADAARTFRRISEEYPQSLEARDIDKLVGAAEQQ